MPDPCPVRRTVFQYSLLPQFGVEAVQLLLPFLPRVLFFDLLPRPLCPRIVGRLGRRRRDFLPIVQLLLSLPLVDFQLPHRLLAARIRRRPLRIALLLQQP